MGKPMQKFKYASKSHMPNKWKIHDGSLGPEPESLNFRKSNKPVSHGSG